MGAERRNFLSHSKPAERCAQITTDVELKNINHITLKGIPFQLLHFIYVQCKFALWTVQTQKWPQLQKPVSVKNKTHKNNKQTLI